MDDPADLEILLGDPNGTSSASSAANSTSSSSSSGSSLYEVPPSVVGLLSCLYGLISLAAAVGNGLVIYVVAVSPRMRTVTNFYIANLAFADVTIALFAIPFQFQAALRQRWDLPEFMCQFCPTVQLFSVNISIFTLVAISLDRYRAIMHPLRRKPSKLFSKVVIVCIWAASLAFALPMGLVHSFAYVPDARAAATLKAAREADGDAVVGDEDEDDTPKKPFCYIDFGPNVTNATLVAFKSYTISLVTVEYFVPLAVISFAYARIAFRLWGSKTPGAAQNDRDQNILGNKKKVIKMLMVVVLIFATCWLPWQTYMTVALIAPQINGYRYINIIFFFCHWLAMSNSCYNPIIYGIYSEKFRREFSTRIPCLRPLLGNPSAGGGGAGGNGTNGGNGNTNVNTSAVITHEIAHGYSVASASAVVCGGGNRICKSAAADARSALLSRSTTALNDVGKACSPSSSSTAAIAGSVGSSNLRRSALLLSVDGKKRDGCHRRSAAASPDRRTDNGGGPLGNGSPLSYSALSREEMEEEETNLITAVDRGAGVGEAEGAGSGGGGDAGRRGKKLKNSTGVMWL